MPRVLHVSQPTEAGVANVVLSLVRDQVQRGWDVHVAAPSEPYLLLRSTELGATTHVWSATRSPGPSTICEARRLHHLLREVRPDLVHLHSAKAGFAGRLATRQQLPTVFQPHAWSFEAVTGPVGILSAHWERFARRWTSLTLCVSEAEQDTGRRHRCLARRTLVVPNGVDLDRWQPTDRDAARRALGLDSRPQVVCVGRLSRQKGQDVLLDAWPHVLEKHPAAWLHLVGDGPERKALERRLPRQASLHGVAPAERWFAAADLVCIPSRWEGMPLVVLESMACGRAVVATDVNGVRESLGSEFLVAPEDAVALADTLGRLLGDAGARQACELRNRSRAVDQFDLRSSTRATAEACLALLG